MKVDEKKKRVFGRKVFLNEGNKSVKNTNNIGIFF